MQKAKVVGYMAPVTRKYVQKPLTVPFGAILRQKLSQKGIPVNRAGR